MFKLLRFALNGIFYIAVALVILYFLPDGLKKTILGTVDSLVSSPTERRETIIKELEEKLGSLSGDPNVAKIVEESKKLISELKVIKD